MELKQEHLHWELDQHFCNGHRNHHSAFVFFFFGLLARLVFVEKHEFERNKNVKLEEVDKGCVLLLGVCLLLLFLLLHGHQLAIKIHEISVDSFLLLEVFQVSSELVLLLFFIVVTFLIFLEILLVHFSSILNQFRMEFIKPVLCDVFLDVTSAFLESIDTFNDAADDFNEQNVSLQVLFVRFMLVVEFYL